MSKFNQLLIGLFVAQLLLVVGIYSSSQPTTASNLQIALLNSDKEKITRIVIDDGESNRSILKKVDGNWHLPEYHQLPANDSMADQILDVLAKTKTGWPVTTTTSSHERFKVSENGYEKRIVLFNGDNELQSLYLGTSPSFRQIHIRRSNEYEVYAVNLNSHDFPVEAKQWFDKTVAQPEGDITGIEGPDFKLQIKGDDWILVDNKDELEEKEVDKLVNSFSSLGVQEVVKETIPDSNNKYTVNTSTGRYVYHFFSKGEKYFVKQDNHNHVYKLSKFDYERITDKTRDKLVKVVMPDKNSITANKTSD